MPIDKHNDPLQSASFKKINEDALLPYRNRIIYSLAIASFVIFTPFVIYNFFQGRQALELFLVMFMLILAIDAWAIYRGKRPPIPLWTLVFPVVGGFALTIMAEHYVGLTWSYPVVLLFFFILPRRTALVASAAVILTIALLMGFNVELKYTTRVVATLSLIAIFTNVFVGIIESLHQKLLMQTITDPLTEAFNRRHMQSVLTRALSRRDRGAPPQALLMIDIDHFKRVNDQHGHATGDKVLKHIADIISHRMRLTDNLYRAGGEEFILYLPDTPAEGAQIIAEALCKQIGATPFNDDVQVTVSIGVSMLNAQDRVDSWLKRSDDALYQAKAAGRNRVVINDKLSEAETK